MNDWPALLAVLDSVPNPSPARVFLSARARRRAFVEAGAGTCLTCAPELPPGDGATVLLVSMRMAALLSATLHLIADEAPSPFCGECTESVLSCTLYFERSGPLPKGRCLCVGLAGIEGVSMTRLAAMGAAYGLVVGSMPDLCERCRSVEDRVSARASAVAPWGTA